MKDLNICLISRLVDPRFAFILLVAGKTPVLSELTVALECAEYSINQVLAKQNAPGIRLQAHSKTFKHLKHTLKNSPDKVAIFVVDELVGQLATVGQYKTGSGGWYASWHTYMYASYAQLLSPG